mmetsp:Transcript_3778/g.7376  ORF Transcript_3778/g.7376 Transcript_3778/m.7376 type:complete len:81 (-) Transcript_3778:330-572(-)
MHQREELRSEAQRTESQGTPQRGSTSGGAQPFRCEQWHQYLTGRSSGTLGSLPETSAGRCGGSKQRESGTQLIDNSPGQR